MLTVDNIEAPIMVLRVVIVILSVKVYKLNQFIRGWINYFKIGSMKGLCERLDSNIRYRLRMCIWKHWKTPKNRAKNLMKLDVPRWAAFKIAYCGDHYARLAHNGWVHKAISNKRLADFGLISMLDYYTARCPRGAHVISPWGPRDFPVGPT